MSVFEGGYLGTCVWVSGYLNERMCVGELYVRERDKDGVREKTSAICMRNQSVPVRGRRRVTADDDAAKH